MVSVGFALACSGSSETEAAGGALHEPEAGGVDAAGGGGVDASAGASGWPSTGGSAGASGVGPGGASLGGAAGSGGAGGVAGSGGSGGSGGAPLPTCQQAGGNRCGSTAAECAGLFKLASSDCVSCCKVPSNPVFDAQWADPYIVRKGDTYYTFATGSTVRRRSSKDLVTWTTADTALETAPWKKADAGFWAPAVYRAKSGKWILYYASEIKGPTSQHCIGRAVSNSITGTFVDNSTTPFLCRSTHWSIDPSVFQDNDGKDFLLWRQDTADMPSGNAFIQRLDDNGQLTFNEHLLLTRAKVEPSWEFDSTGGVLENPAMIHEDGIYHLLYSGFRWQTAKYANGRAICDAPTGPCTKKSKETPWLGSKGDMLGPGGADFVKAEDGTLFIYMHGWLAPDVGPEVGSRKLWMYRLKVNGESVSTAPM